MTNKTIKILNRNNQFNVALKKFTMLFFYKEDIFSFYAAN